MEIIITGSIYFSHETIGDLHNDGSLGLPCSSIQVF